MAGKIKLQGERKQKCQRGWKALWQLDTDLIPSISKPRFAPQVLQGGMTAWISKEIGIIFIQIVWSWICGQKIINLAGHNSTNIDNIRIYWTTIRSKYVPDHYNSSFLVIFSGSNYNFSCSVARYLTCLSVETL
jgi:hypothetical protein